MPIADPRNRARFPRQETAMMHCDLRVRWKVASDLRFRAAISEPKTPSFCGISGDLAPSTRKSLAIPKGPKIEKIQSRLKISISLEIFNLDWNFQSWPSDFPTKIGVWWVARLKFSISIENFNPGGRSWIFSIFGPLGIAIVRFWCAKSGAWDSLLQESEKVRHEKKNPNLNFWVRIFFGGVGVFHVNGWGPKSSVCPSKPRESNTFFGGISRDFARIYPGILPEKVWEKKMFGFNSRPLKGVGKQGYGNRLRWHVCRVNFARKIFFELYEFSYERCSEIFPEIFEPLFCGSEKILENSLRISH